MVRSLSSADWYKSKGSHNLIATHSGDGTVDAKYTESEIYITITGLAAGESVTINTPLDFRLLDFNALCGASVSSRVLTLKNGSNTVEALDAVTTSTMYRADSLDKDYLEWNKDNNDLILAASGGSGDSDFFVTLTILDISKL